MMKVMKLLALPKHQRRSQPEVKEEPNNLRRLRRYPRSKWSYQ
jgi:hypothetical protein